MLVLVSLPYHKVGKKIMVYTSVALFILKCVPFKFFVLYIMLPFTLPELFKSVKSVCFYECFYFLFVVCLVLYVC